MTVPTGASHYSNLAEYHASAAKAANKIERNLRIIEQANKELAEARKNLAGVQSLIKAWYTEPEVPDPS